MAAYARWTCTIKGLGSPLGPDALVVARDEAWRDKRGGDARVGKRFAVCRAWGHYEDVLFSAQPRESSISKYELIPDGVPTPVWFFADHDCYVAKAERSWNPDDFARAVYNLYVDYFGIERPEQEIGRSVQISSSSRSDKLSVNIKINVGMEGGLMEAKARASKVAETAGPDLAPDLAVYSTANQQIRCIGSCKLGVGAVKLPWGNSSRRFVDHLVRRHRHNPQIPLPAASIPHVSPPRKRARVEERGGLASEEDGVRLVLTKSGLAHRLGPRFEANACRIQQLKYRQEDDSLWCYVDGTHRTDATLVCPFAHHVHRTNRASVTVTRNDVIFRCMSPACRDSHIRIPIAVEEAKRR